ncbi:hypothetical protein L6R53_19680 [Myxococcota bacterium]|nr:hypothetical protein [Myxococcota bacterium]
MNNAERFALVFLLVLGSSVLTNRSRADDIVTRFGDSPPVGHDPDMLTCTVKSIKDYKGGATVVADEALVPRPWSGRYAEQFVPYLANVEVVGGELRVNGPPTAGMVTIYRDDAPAVSVAFFLAEDGWNCAEALNSAKNERR